MPRARQLPPRGRAVRVGSDDELPLPDELVLEPVVAEAGFDGDSRVVALRGVAVPVALPLVRV
jgi:hypothetical protein